MKKLLLAALLILATALCASAADIEVLIDGAPLKCDDANGNAVEPFIENGTTYLPVRAIASAFNLTIEWQDETKSVFIGAAPESAQKGEYVNIFIDGAPFEAKDASGKRVYPILKDASTFLPVRAIGEALGKSISWDGATKTVAITSPVALDTEKTYAIIARGTQSAISLLSPDSESGSALTMSDFGGYEHQLWKLVAVNGTYNIQSVKNGCNFDVSGKATTAGARVLVYTASDGDNQRFEFKSVGGCYKIYAKHSLLPIESSAGEVRQNGERTSQVQEWELREVNEASVNTASTVLRKIVKAGTTMALSATSENALALSEFKNDALQKWALVVTASGDYQITTSALDRSIDVANESTAENSPLIAYKTGTQDNQKWLLEKQPDGTYMIKSVHSGLYLSQGDDGIVQKAVENADRWEISTAQ